jgi:Kef-type K+ transport system membrane component KefB|tara:strand:+ start:4388 stop:6058 length:1671 start_codon:yes stop_codon:yes gene_type:complete
MDPFLELSLIIGITVLVAGMTKLLRQPLIIGYILAGIIISPYFLNLLSSVEIIEVFSKIGITLLLFIVGISLSPKVIRDVGKVSVVTGIGQIIFTSLFGFLISRLLGFSIVSSLYIAIALTFSSTIIIMKLLSDKKDIEKLYGKISIGFLLVQDFFVLVLLILISAMSNNFNIGSINLASIMMGIVSLGLFVLLGIYLLPRLSSFFAKSQEFLFLFSIGWGLGVASLFNYIGLSMEIGALIAGIALSMSPFQAEISSKMKPLRDFFIILFFILLGSQMSFSNIGDLVFPAIIFSLFILIGNPLIVVILMGLLGYKKKTSFQSGFTVAQISEFSLILVALGVSVGHLSSNILSLITLVGIITISGSTYLILYSDKLYHYFERYLSIFERKKTRHESKSKAQDFDAVLFGFNSFGREYIKYLKKAKLKFLVVDYNPEKIPLIAKMKLNHKYGDVDDELFLRELGITEKNMVISTIPNFETNKLLIQRVRSLNKKIVIISSAYGLDEALELYKLGATYVFTPSYLGGDYSPKIVKEFGLDKNKYMRKRKSHIEELKKKT